MKRLLMILFACICFAAHADDSVVLDQKELIIEFDASSNDNPLLRLSQLRGRVVDKTTREGIAFASVVLYDEHDNVVDATVTNQYGYFMLDIDVGEFTMEVSCIAYNTTRFKVVVTDDGFEKDVEITPDN